MLRVRVIACATWLALSVCSADAQPLANGPSGNSIPARMPPGGKEAASAIAPVESHSDASLQARIGELYKIFRLINEDRARYGVPPLKWNDQLAAHAQAWADQLARMGRLDHAPREGRTIERENLVQALPTWTVERMVQMWRNEEKDYVPGTFPDVARDGDWQKVAHWTQEISRLSREIGCGIAKGSGFLWLDCRFSPGGNKDGEAFGPPVAIEQPKLPATDVVGKTAELERDRKLRQDLIDSLAAMPRDQQLDCSSADLARIRMCEMYRKIQGLRRGESQLPLPPPPPPPSPPPPPPPVPLPPLPPPPWGMSGAQATANEKAAAEILDQTDWDAFLGIGGEQQAVDPMGVATPGPSDPLLKAVAPVPRPLGIDLDQELEIEPM
jgi:hypothetical protein